MARFCACKPSPIAIALAAAAAFHLCHIANAQYLLEVVRFNSFACEFYICSYFSSNIRRLKRNARFSDAKRQAQVLAKVFSILTRAHKRTDARSGQSQGTRVAT